MSNKRPVTIEELEIGQALPGNILDAEDKVIFRAGLKLTPQIVEVWKRRGSGPYFLAESDAPAGSGPIASAPIASAPTVSAPAAKQAVVDNIAAHYNAGQCAQIAEWFVDAEAVLDGFAGSLVADETPSQRLLEASLDTALNLLSDDVAPIVHYIVTDDRSHPGQPSMARRSCYLAALAGIVAQQYGFDREDCYKICMAGMLHDMALFPPLLSKLQDSFETEEEKESVITRHAFMSTDLLTARISIPDLVRVIINQVHEQLDGGGYPRGIPGHLMNTMARVLSIADAFLTMIGAASSQPAFVAGDAIAYMIHHTNLGVFDRDCMRAFLAKVTLYGIGARVLLEDQRQATVLRSVSGAPLQPIVVVGDSDAGEVVDLSVQDIKIVSPVVEADLPRRTRMPKSKITEVLWKQDSASHQPAFN